MSPDGSARSGTGFAPPSGNDYLEQLVASLRDVVGREERPKVEPDGTPESAAQTTERIPLPRPAEEDGLTTARRVVPQEELVVKRQVV